MRINILLALLMLGAGIARADCDPKGRTYPACADQKALFNEEMMRAKKDQKPLLVVFGADWCPWCQSLHRILKDADLPEAAKYNITEIALYDGTEKLANGLEVLDRVLKMAKQKKASAGIPLLAILNPEKEKAVFIETAPLEKNTKVSKGHDPVKLFTAIEAGKKKVQ